MKSGTASLDRVTWADRYYEMRTNANRLTYVLEASNQIMGYVMVGFVERDLHVEAVAVEKRAQGKGYGAALLRWAETIARQADCRRVELWGIDEAVELYGKFKYQKIAGQQMKLDDGVYFRMVKPILSHLG